MSGDMLGAVVRGIVQLPVQMLGAVGDLCEKLLSREDEDWFAALKRFLRKENPWDAKGPVLIQKHLVQADERELDLDWQGPFARLRH